MPVGTPIVAARAGTVVKVRDGQGGRLPDPAGNHVRIEHDDGTHSAYLHLSRGSVRVKPGQRVEIGTPLGKSGNTGRSTGPPAFRGTEALRRGDGVDPLPLQPAGGIAAQLRAEQPVMN